MNPTLAAPDEDPFLWLEEIDGAASVDWVSAQNATTLQRFGGTTTQADADALAAIMDRPDNIPFITRRGEAIYNFWRDADHVRGLWRRTSLASFRTETPDWQTVLDVDAFAEAEGQDWVFHGAAVLPGSNARPNAAIADRLRMLRRFIVFLPDLFMLRTYTRALAVHVQTDKNQRSKLTPADGIGAAATGVGS